MQGVPSDVWSLINAHLTPLEILTLGRVSRKLHQIHRGERAWAIHRDRLNRAGVSLSPGFATWKYFARFLKHQNVERLLVSFGRLLIRGGKFRGKQIMGQDKWETWRFSEGVCISRRVNFYIVSRNGRLFDWILRKNSIQTFFYNLVRTVETDEMIEHHRKRFVTH